MLAVQYGAEKSLGRLLSPLLCGVISSTTGGMVGGSMFGGKPALSATVPYTMFLPHQRVT